MTKNDTQLLEGIISVTSRGIGYVTAEGYEEDIEIPEGRLNTALHRDVVSISLLPEKSEYGRVQGEVVEIISRAKTRFVGTLEEESGVRYLKPDNFRFYPRMRVTEGSENIGENIKVLVELTRWENPERDPEGKVVSVIGEKGEHETEMQAILIGHDFDVNFPPEVEEEAKKIGEHRDITSEEVAKRRDMRDVTTFTIDPADAKDFDDALSFREVGGDHVEVGIHIADVTHYVLPGGPIDTEAQERGTSIYLVDRTIPMLPEVLSNDVCSLNPNEDKLAFSAIFTLSKDGSVTDRWFGRTVINSDKRFTYQEAQDRLDTKEGEFAQELLVLEDLAKKLRAKRFKEGSIGFERDEVKFKLDEHGTPIDVVAKERLETMMLIEDFMLLANREVAKHLFELCEDKKHANSVLIYRIHDAPDPDKIEQLAIFLRAIGYDLEVKNGEVSSKDINNLIQKVKDTPEERLITTATIRSMAKAVYSTKNIGHFSLAFDFYTHFTSPIRRYPDMMVHRILASHLDGSPIPPEELQTYKRLTLESSQKEIEASAAERESIKYKQVEYMQKHVGEEFDGVVTGVADFGVFVEEGKTKAEGMIRMRDLGDDYFSHDPKQYAVIGERNHKKYQLGDTLRVKLVEADLDQRQLTWVPVS